jgi:hypothetical protein
MTKFWHRKVRMNRPTTSTEQMLATASNGVSSTFFSTGGCAGCSSVGVLIVFILSLVIVLTARGAQKLRAASLGVPDGCQAGNQWTM